MAELNVMLPFLCPVGASDNLSREALIYDGDAIGYLFCFFVESCYL